MQKDAAIAGTKHRSATAEIARLRNACGEPLNANSVPSNSEIGGFAADTRRHVKADCEYPVEQSANKMPHLRVPPKMAIAGTPIRILSLDLGRSTGYAMGEAGRAPDCGSCRLIKPSEPIELLPGAVARLVSELIELSRPDLIVREDWMAPAAQPSQSVIIAHLLLAGAVMTVADLHFIPCKAVPVQTWRRHFCGRAAANPRSRIGRTSAQRAADRTANKEMVLSRAKLLKYVPADCMDYEASDAAGIFDYASAYFARVAPKDLFMFGEGAAA